MAQEESKSVSKTAACGGNPPRELTVFDYIRVVYKYRRLILLICVLTVGTAGTISYLRQPRFVATTSVVPPLETGSDSMLNLGMFAGGASLLRNAMDTGNMADKYVEILTSRAVSDAVIDRFDLMRVYNRGPLRQKTRARLQKNTTIRVSKEGTLYVTVEDKDPNRAAAMANAYVEELDKQNKRLSIGQATGKRTFLETRLQEMEQKFSRIDSIRSYEARVQETLYELLMRELELAKIEEAKSMPTIQVLDPAVPPEIRKPRGTIGKAILAGVVAFVCVVFFAFTREYYVECGRGPVGSPQAGPRG